MLLKFGQIALWIQVENCRNQINNTSASQSQSRLVRTTYLAPFLSNFWEYCFSDPEVLQRRTKAEKWSNPLLPFRIKDRSAFSCLLRFRASGDFYWLMKVRTAKMNMQQNEKNLYTYRNKYLLEVLTYSTICELLSTSKFHVRFNQTVAIFELKIRSRNKNIPLSALHAKWAIDSVDDFSLTLKILQRSVKHCELWRGSANSYFLLSVMDTISNIRWPREWSLFAEKELYFRPANRIDSAALGFFQVFNSYLSVHTSALCSLPYSHPRIHRIP